MHISAIVVNIVIKLMEIQHSSFISAKHTHEMNSCFHH